MAISYVFKSLQVSFLLFIVSVQVSISSPNWPDETGTALSLLGLFSGKSWDLPLLCTLQHLTWRQTPPLPTVLMAMHQQWLVPSLCGQEAVEEYDPGGDVQYTAYTFSSVCSCGSQQESFLALLTGHALGIPS